MSDPFNNPATMMTDPVNRAYAISPHATAALTLTTRAIYIGGDGDLICRLHGDTADVTFVGLVAGTLLPLRVSHVRNTSTTTFMVALL
jgi:hypothetical protein